MKATWNASEERFEVTRDCLGTLSHATMRSEDLIPAFVDALDSIRESITLYPAGIAGKGLEPQACAEAARIDDLLAWVENESECVDRESDVVTELFDALDEFAPTGFYFGAHPDDGCDYGYWESEESIEERELAESEAHAMVALLEKAGRSQLQPYRFPACSN